MQVTEIKTAEALEQWAIKAPAGSVVLYSRHDIPGHAGLSPIGEKAHRLACLGLIWLFQRRRTKNDKYLTTEYLAIKAAKGSMPNFMRPEPREPMTAKAAQEYESPLHTPRWRRRVRSLREEDDG